MPLTCHAFIATSLDGFIAREDGALDWLHDFSTAEEDHGYDAFMSDKDGIIMGRGTYQSVLGFGHWPYALPTVILSQSLTVADIPDTLADHVALCDMQPTEVLTALAEEGWSRCYVDGGQVLQSFLREGLLDEITLNRVPVLLGQGRPLFGALPGDVALALTSSHGFASGLVSSTYRILR